MILMVSSAAIFGSEFLGTMLLLLLGGGVVANALLPKSKGLGGGNLMINVGWGIAVMVGVYAAYLTGGHLNPAVTIGVAAAGNDLAAGVPATAGNIGIYLAAQMLGAFCGAVLMWLVYKQHFDEKDDPATKLACFSTGPAIRNSFWNCMTEAIATFVLVLWCLISGFTKGAAIGPLGVTFLIIGLGASLGGPTGYAINPARDLGPRIAHAVLPIKGKGSSDWGYAWVPVVAPIIGALVAAGVYRLCWA